MQPYSFLHISIIAVGIPAMFFLAYRLRLCSDRCFHTLILSIGIILLSGEIYKQFFIYFMIDNRQYNWWYFPFQLCSLPMYLCIIISFLKKKSHIRIRLLTFLQAFSLLGGIMALLVPEGFIYPEYIFLTLHGFLWHFILVFLGTFLAMYSGEDGIDRSVSGYIKTIPVFLVCCIVATVINVLAGPASYADMFYISPYYPSTQYVFHNIAESYGILTGNLLYIIAMITGGFICHMSSHIIYHFKNNPPA